MLEYADLIESARRDPYFLLKFSNEGVGWHLLTLAVPTDDVPDIRIVHAIRRASGQKDLVSANQEPGRTDAHGLH